MNVELNVEPGTRRRRTAVPSGRRSRPAADDDGSSLMDLLVSLGIMSVVTAMIVVSVVQMFRLTSSAESRTIAQTSVSLALLRIDRQIRYSSGIGTAHTADGALRIEYEVVMTGRHTCYQLRLAGGILQQRSWTSKANPVNPTVWSTLASRITAGSFTIGQPTDDVGFQRLTVRISAGTSPAVRTSEVTFTALNTDLDTPVNNPVPCVEGRDLP
jgi:hypothetical protein